MNWLALAWMLFSLPLVASYNLNRVWRRMRELHNGLPRRQIARRHLERAIFHVIALLSAFVIGLASLRDHAVWPSGLVGWLVLIGFFLLPILFQVDGIRDFQLWREIDR